MKPNHAFRVVWLLFGIVVLTWYGKRGGSWPGGGAPPAPALAAVNMVRVAGNQAAPCLDIYGDTALCAAAYAVECLAVKKDTARVCGVGVSGGLPVGGELLPPDSGASVVPKSVYPFAGDSLRAVFLMFEGATALICDSSVFTPRSEGGVQSQFREKLDLVVIPPAGEEEIRTVRDMFRPRFLAVVPPCAEPAAQNIICGTAGGDRFRYDFWVRRGKLELAD